MSSKLKGEKYSTVCDVCEECDGVWKREQSVILERTEIRMVHWMCGVSLKDRVPSVSV